MIVKKLINRNIYIKKPRTIFHIVRGLPYNRLDYYFHKNLMGVLSNNDILYSKHQSSFGKMEFITERT